MHFEYKLGLWVAISFISFNVFAAGRFSQEGPTLNRKVRNLGMGNVGIAIEGHHDSSPFYNPAGLNDLQDGRLQIFSQTADMSKSTVTLIKDLRDLAQEVDKATNQADRTRALADFISDNTGKYRHFRYTLDLFNYVRHNLAVGMLVDERLDLAFHDDSFSNFEIQNLGDIAMYLSSAYGFWDKLLQVGITMKPTIRMSMDEEDQEVTFSDVLGEDDQGDPLLSGQLKKIYKKRHFGLGVDLGLKTNLSFPMVKDLPFYKYLKPSFGITWQDIGNTDFGSAPGNQQTIGVGVAVHPALWKLKNTVALDFRDINLEQPLLSKLHFGIESAFPWILTGRAGVSQGYFTAGATADFVFMKLDAALYFEEIGIYTTRDGNLRWAATLSFGI